MTACRDSSCAVGADGFDRRPSCEVVGLRRTRIRGIVSGKKRRVRLASRHRRSATSGLRRCFEASQAVDRWATAEHRSLRLSLVVLVPRHRRRGRQRDPSRLSRSAAASRSGRHRSCARSQRIPPARSAPAVRRWRVRGARPRTRSPSAPADDLAPRPRLHHRAAAARRPRESALGAHGDCTTGAREQVSARRLPALPRQREPGCAPAGGGVTTCCARPRELAEAPTWMGPSGIRVHG